MSYVYPICADVLSSRQICEIAWSSMLLLIEKKIKLTHIAWMTSVF